MNIQKAFVVWTLLAFFALLSTPIYAQDIRCPAGYQPYAGRCISQRMADYISCVEASGGNRETLVYEVSRGAGSRAGAGVQGAGGTLAGGGSAGLTISRKTEQAIARRLEQSWHSNAMAECSKVLSQSALFGVPQARTGAEAARAKLQVLGVGWESEKFIGAIVDGDVRTVELFIRGGMSPSLNYKGASAIVYALQADANNRLMTLDAFLKAGFNPNQHVVDSRIMRLYDLIPPDFSDKNAPPGYEAWNKRFAGPADLWIVIRASYAGPVGEDFAQLKRLAARGADFKYSLAYLSEYESVLGSTPVYWDVRNEVERIAKLPVTPHPIR